MNPLLTKLQPYPFERLRKLFAGVTPNADYTPISLGIGEPKHPTPAFIRQALTRTENNISGAARLLGISRPTLYDLLKQYQLTA